MLNLPVLSRRQFADYVGKGLIQPDSEVSTYGNSRWVHYSDAEDNRFELKETLDAALTHLGTASPMARDHSRSTR